MISRADIDRWFHLALVSTPGELIPCCLVDEKSHKQPQTREEVAAIFVAAMAGADRETFYGVLQRCADIGDLPGGDQPVAWMGGGSSALANADFFAIARTAVLKLIEENRALRQKLGEA